MERKLLFLKMVISLPNLTDKEKFVRITPCREKKTGVLFMKKGNIRSRLYRKFKHIPRLLFAFLSSLIIISYCKEEEQNRQVELDTERMEAFFEDFDEDVSSLAMANNKTVISENLFKDFTKKTKFREYELAIEEYSLYFNLDSEKVFEFTKNLTNDLSEPLTITIGGKPYTATNAESTAMFISYDIWKDIYNTRQSKKKYNLKKEDYVVSEEITHLEYNDKGEIIMRNGLTFNQLLGKASYALGDTPSLGLAISNHESNYRRSPQARNQNNYFGMKGSGIPGVVDNGHITLPSPEAGTIYGEFNKIRIENENSYNGLYEFSGVYVNGTKTKPSDTWFKDVSNKAAIYAANEEYYFGIPEEEELESEIQLALTRKD